MSDMMIEEFKARFAHMTTPTAHSNRVIVAGVPIKWCDDCKNVWPGSYKVSNELWKSVVDKVCYLCPCCLDTRVKEKRGYGLERSDFPEAPVNRVLHFAYERGRANA